MTTNSLVSMTPAFDTACRMKWMPIFLVAMAMAARSHTQIQKPEDRNSYFGGSPSVILWNLCYVALLAEVILNFWKGVEISQPLLWVGYLILLLALGLRRWALKKIQLFYNVFIVVQKNHEIIKTGPYGYLRHPLHLGLFCEMLGLALVSQNGRTVFPLSVAFAVLIARNINEEQTLKKELGQEYKDYCRQAWDIIDLLPRSLLRRMTK